MPLEWLLRTIADRQSIVIFQPGFDRLQVHLDVPCEVNIAGEKLECPHLPCLFVPVVRYRDRFGGFELGLGRLPDMQANQHH